MWWTLVGSDPNRRRRLDWTVGEEDSFPCDGWLLPVPLSTKMLFVNWDRTNNRGANFVFSVSASVSEGCMSGECRWWIGSTTVPAPAHLIFSCMWLLGFIISVMFVFTPDYVVHVYFSSLQIRRKYIYIYKVKLCCNSSMGFRLSLDNYPTLQSFLL